MSAGRRDKKTNPFYLSKEWEAVRYQALLRDNYTCLHCKVKCLGKKRDKPSPHVDHIVPVKEDPSLKLELGNLRTLCHSCHSKVSAASKANRPEIGADGYPVFSG
jgi:5-methylcytosine-specific restriction protein A